MKMINDPSIKDKRTRCCQVTPKVSQENKLGEKEGDWHYMCPSCDRDPCLVKIVK